ncbi:asparagine synthase (glutamine-hydrolyzing) [uncultured Ruegeria sp.]|uniref:asparagine synthase (glutamine-hydrolyzing) n=1 Tax=uncultured Ruegeria sp. TaxID=259304 RepID=UPI002621B038|nr:asparagine synthase (glutamine-hydrolyzing) [uncultured Ruegeria sp.]
MCGIAGYLAFKPVGLENGTTSLKAMCDSIQHRGPDADGMFVDQDTGIALGQRRLAIVDLTETGEQPMTSPSGRYCIVYNGEIYGFLELRQQLIDHGVTFRGTSDTEVLLASMDLWGIRKTLDLVHGMFAFAVFDRQSNRVVFARDRLGKKPLYLGIKGGHLLFGSELKALRAHPAFGTPEVDRRAQAQYARYAFIPAPLTIYQGVMKLPAGTMVEVQLDAPPVSSDDLVDSLRTFWDLRDRVEACRADPYGDETQALGGIEDALHAAVGERMVADVPVGTFLSGGIDSSLITAMMQEQAAGKVISFTVRFDHDATNEADHAAAIAKHLGTDHHEVTATPEMAFDLLQKLPQVYDEPFADPSAFPTLLVSELARAQLKVVMSGDGGDESFGGYERYVRMMAMERIGAKLPGPAVSALAASPAFVTSAAAKVLRPLAPASMRDQITPDRLSKVASIARHPDFRSRYDALFTLWNPPAASCQGVFHSHQIPDGLSSVDKMMLLDSELYLPESILVKADRASMSTGLEIRAPLLDYRVVEAAWRSPDSLRYDGKSGKVALRRLLDKRVPKSLYDRPKQGFGIPLNDWLRGPLKSIANEVFASDNLVGDVFDRTQLNKRWTEHLSGARNWGPHLWVVLMYHFWQEEWLR